MKGILGLLQSRKAVMSLIILGCTTYVSVSGHMDASYAAVMSVVASIYMHYHTKTDALSMAKPIIQDPK